MRDKRFDDFIKKSEEIFKELELNEENLDKLELSEENHKKLDDIVNEFFLIYNDIWDKVVERNIVDDIWKNHYQETTYHYVFKLLH